MTPDETIAAIRADARFTAASAKLAADHARMVEDCITLTQIPAPPFAEEERAAARLGLQKLPRNANPTRQRNRCEITGRPRGTFRQFGLGRAKIRELAFAGNIPGITKASW